MIVCDAALKRESLADIPRVLANLSHHHSVLNASMPTPQMTHSWHSALKILAQMMICSQHFGDDDSVEELAREYDHAIRRTYTEHLALLSRIPKSILWDLQPRLSSFGGTSFVTPLRRESNTFLMNQRASDETQSSVA